MAHDRNGDPKPELIHGIVEGLRQVLDERLPRPSNLEAGADVDRRLRAQMDAEDDARMLRAAPYVREFINALSRDDVKRLEKLIGLKPETVSWVEAKNERELKNLDGAVEFITSSRTAAKVLMWVAGTAVTFLTGTWALAKAGIDAFSLFRGGIR